MPPVGRSGLLSQVEKAGSGGSSEVQTPVHSWMDSSSMIIWTWETEKTALALMYIRNQPQFQRSPYVKEEQYKSDIDNVK